MANTREIKRRIRSVQSTAKITKAMEMIATSKMRRAQERGLAGRPYAQKMHQVIADLAAIETADVVPHPCLECRPMQNIELVLITPDRGLAGGLHAAINRRALQFISEQKAAVNVVAVGRKGLDAMRRLDVNLKAQFTHLGDKPVQADTLPVSRIILEDYTSRLVDAVYVIYPAFVSTMVQKAEVHQILPIVPAVLPSIEKVDYIYEPNSREVLEKLLPRFVEMEIFHLVLESIASEQSARMVAMRNATENARELIDDLMLAYNKARQEAITTELLDITGGVAALD